MKSLILFTLILSACGKSSNNSPAINNSTIPNSTTTTCSNNPTCYNACVSLWGPIVQKDCVIGSGSACSEVEGELTACLNALSPT